MKKVLFITLLYTASLYPQVKVDASIPFSFGFTKTITTAQDTLSRIIDSLAQSHQTYAGYGNANSMFRSASADTFTTAVKQLEQYWSASIIADDTIEVSTSASFVAYDKVVILPDVPLTVGPYNKTKTNLYIRRYSQTGAAGTPRYYIYVYGW